jgi:hypothetical protein
MDGHSLTALQLWSFLIIQATNIQLLNPLSARLKTMAKSSGEDVLLVLVMPVLNLEKQLLKIPIFSEFMV